MKGVDISLAWGWIEVASNVHPPGEVVISMRPVSLFANGPGSEIERLRAELHGPWRQAAHAVMVLLSAHGLPAAQITGPDAGDRRPLDQPLAASWLRAELLECRFRVIEPSACMT